MHVPIRPLYQLCVLRRLWATTLFLLCAIDIAAAWLISFLTPVATTVWTAGQDATISWNCSDPYPTSFPIILYAGPKNQPVPGLAPLGQISCSSSLTIKVPTTIPSGSSYYLGVTDNTNVLVSNSFTIINPATTSGALTATATPTNGTSTKVTTTTTTTTMATSSTTPKSNNDIGTLNGDSNSNDIAIGGGIAGAVAGIAAVVVLLVFLRRQQRKNQLINVKESGAEPLPENVLPSIKNTTDGGEFGRYPQTKPSNRGPVNCTQVPLAIDPQSTSGSPHSWPGSIQHTESTPFPISFSSPPLKPSRPVSSPSPQYNVQEIQQRLAFHWEQLPNQKNPQYISSSHPTQTFSSLRGPEEAGGTALTSSNYELQQQINFLHTELNQLQAKLDSSN